MRGTGSTGVAYLMSASFVGLLSDPDREALRRAITNVVPDGPLRLALETRVWLTRHRAADR